MKIKIVTKNSYSPQIDTDYVSINTVWYNKKWNSGKWYIAIFSDTFYLHKDGMIRDGIKEEYISLGYFDSEKEAREFYENYKERGEMKIILDSE